MVRKLPLRSVWVHFLIPNSSLKSNLISYARTSHLSGDAASLEAERLFPPQAAATPRELIVKTEMFFRLLGRFFFFACLHDWAILSLWAFASEMPHAITHRLISSSQQHQLQQFLCFYLNLIFSWASFEVLLAFVVHFLFQTTTSHSGIHNG